MPTATHAQDPDTIRSLFSRICGCYDFFNRLFTFGLDQTWRKRLVQLTLQSNPQNILDVATGSGDVALALQQQGKTVTAIDFCQPLLDRAKQRGVRNTLHADALNLPFPNNTFDAATIAFGLRNLQSRERGLQEILRTLKPGGTLAILETSPPPPAILPFYKLHVGIIMPTFAQLIAQSGSDYRYLYQSTLNFLTPQQLQSTIENCGFTQVSFELHTLHTIAIHTATKPLR